MDEILILVGPIRVEEPLWELEKNNRIVDEKETHNSKMLKQKVGNLPKKQPG